ncbi:MAG: hypothetical protein WBK91_05875 [Alphaproteobacteria bacterium]
MNQLQTIFPREKSNVSAEIVGNTLVASFRASNPPILWRLDMEKNHSFTLSIQKPAEDWELGVMSPKGEFAVVARFDERHEVDQAFTAVETAMFRNPHSTGAKVWRISMMVAAILAVTMIGFIVYSVVQTALNPDVMRRAAAARPAAAAGATAATAPTLKSGVPADADAVLGRKD